LLAFEASVGDLFVFEGESEDPNSPASSWFSGAPEPGDVGAAILQDGGNNQTIEPEIGILQLNSAVRFKKGR
jgi:hypothetical protein